VQRLSQAQLERLLAWVRDLHAETDLAGYARHVVRRLPEIVPSDVTSYNEVDLEGQTIRWIAEPDLRETEPEAEGILVAHLHEHPLIRYAQAQPSLNLPHAVKISDLLTAREWHRIGIYNEFFQLLSLEDQMAIGFSGRDGNLIGIALNRSAATFTDDERAALDIVLPHVAQAWRTAAAVTEANWQVGALSMALDALGSGVVGLDHLERIRFATRQAREWLRLYFGAPVRGHERSDDLPEPVRLWVRRQRELLGMRDDFPPPPFPLSLERDGRQLVVHLIPRSATGTAVLILEEHVRRLEREDVIGLGLTRRQADIVILAAQGRTNLEIAEALTISVNTVRSHMEDIFARLGVRNRAELTGFVLGRDANRP
jgi:DNA-binding CsgD family transcriptional regulator